MAHVKHLFLVILALKATENLSVCPYNLKIEQTEG